MTRVREIMHPRVARIQPEASLAEVIRMLVRESVSGVPVVEPDCRLVGVVSMRDVLAAIAELLDACPSDSFESVLMGRQVMDIMTPMVFSVSPDMPITELAGTLHEARLHRAFVVDHGRLSGVVSTFDVMRAAAQPT